MKTVYSLSKFALCSILTLCSFSTAFGDGNPSSCSKEAFCNSHFTGKARGLCIAYCEATNCDSNRPQASPRACQVLLNKFTAAGTDAGVTNVDFAHCKEVVACPCGTLNAEAVFDIPDSNANFLRGCRRPGSANNTYEIRLSLDGVNFVCAQVGNGTQSFAGTVAFPLVNACVAELRKLSTGCMGLTDFVAP